MADKFKKGDFGYCPRVLCFNQAVLPVGLSDIPMGKAVKFYCPKCEDIYHGQNKRWLTIDGAYFGTTFPHLLLQVFPNLIPSKTTERYVPRIFGFKIHEVANLHRKQDEIRVKMLERLQEHRDEKEKDRMSE
jgi:casein kinase II subunit beta